MLVNLHLSEDHESSHNNITSEDNNQDTYTDPTSIVNTNDVSNDELLIQATKTNKPPSLPKPTSTPADIRNILSSPPSSKRSANVNEILYHVRAHDTSSSVSLIDRGANGGIAGKDVRIIEHLNRRVDVQGIDNHQINDIPIVTAGGVTKTQKGDVILILHQYAYVGKGTSIHSSAQIEAYKNHVDDRAIKAGGQQMITTLDGYYIPLSIKNALPRMNLRPYTDAEWNTLPHVILTSETTWDPSDLDLDLPSDEQWFDSIEYESNLLPNSRFDDFGNYLHRYIANTNIVSSLEDSIDTYVLYHTNTDLHSTDSASFLPYLSLIHI